MRKQHNEGRLGGKERGEKQKTQRPCTESCTHLSFCSAASFFNLKGRNQQDVRSQRGNRHSSGSPEARRSDRTSPSGAHLGSGGGAAYEAGPLAASVHFSST